MVRHLPDPFALNIWAYVGGAGARDYSWCYAIWFNIMINFDIVQWIILLWHCTANSCNKLQCMNINFNSFEHGIQKILRPRAAAPSPAWLRAYLRDSRVAKLVLLRLSPGAHWNHFVNMLLRQITGEFTDCGLAWMLSSSPERKPRYVPINVHWDAWIESCWSRQGRWWS
jgi:hypothetical protein